MTTVTDEMVEAACDDFNAQQKIENDLAPHDGQAQAEAREALAFLVCNPMVAKTMLPQARGIGPEATEWLYPARREADARSMAKLMRADLIPLYPMGKDQ